MTIKSLINDIVKACIDLYMENDYDYVLDSKRKGKEPTHLNLSEQVDFIKKQNLAHPALTDRALEKAAMQVSKKLAAIEADMDTMISVEYVLDRVLTDAGHKLLKREWKAFYYAPRDYEDTIIVDMVLQYLRETNQ